MLNQLSGLSLFPLFMTPCVFLCPFQKLYLGHRGNDREVGRLLDASGISALDPRGLRPTQAFRDHAGDKVMKVGWITGMDRDAYIHQW